MPGKAPIARIAPAPWFRHAASLRELEHLLESRVRALECGRDARAGFARLRRAQIAPVSALLDARGFGAAGAWVERLELAHAQQYLRAADSWDRGQQALTPPPWRAVFAHDRSRGAGAVVRVSVEASTIAHLVYDLPIAIARTGTAATHGVEPATAYEQLTQVYAATIDDALLSAAGRGDRHQAPAITAAWQRELRAQAWEDAVALDEGDERAREVAFRRIELAAMCEVRRLLAR
jgi:hypothetical protein